MVIYCGVGSKGAAYSIEVSGAHRAASGVVLRRTSSFLLSLRILNLLPLLFRSLKLTAFMPQMPFVICLRVVFCTPGAFFGCRRFPSAAAACRRAFFVVLCLCRNVHESLVTLLISEVIVRHEVFLDVGHGRGEGIEEECGFRMRGAKGVLEVVGQSELVGASCSGAASVEASPLGIKFGNGGGKV